jgi:hypothetical protein
MPLPIPKPGMVVSYSYLWRYEYDSGLEEGRKDRPCLIVLSTEEKESGTEVTIVPITHKQPANHEFSVEIPLRVKENLGLDMDNSWVIANEANQFIWPGFDLRPIQTHHGQQYYGFIPPKLFHKIKNRMLDLIIKQRTLITLRD